MDYQRDLLEKLGYVKQPEATEFVRETEFAKAIVIIEWSANPDKIMYHSVVRAKYKGEYVATWFSEKSYKFHATVKQAEETVRFVADILEGMQ